MFRAITFPHLQESSAPEDGQNNCPKHVELNGIINKPLLLRLVGCLYYLYQWCTVKQISDNEIYLLIKYIKCVLWRIAKLLSYIEDARCLEVKLAIKEANILTPPIPERQIGRHPKHQTSTKHIPFRTSYNLGEESCYLLNILSIPTQKNLSMLNLSEEKRNNPN